MRKPTNITVSVLDLTGLFAQALDMRRAADALSPARSDEKGSVSDSDSGPIRRVYTPGKIAYVKAGDKLFVLDDDGTGHEVSNTEPYELSLYGEFAGATPDQFSISANPLYVVNLTPSQILGTPVLKEQELGQFIRTFGRRLEGNFAIWREELAPYFPLTGEGESVE